VIGASDPLQEARSAFGRADIDDEIDIAPIDAEIERRGGDHRAQAPARHRRLDFPPLRHIERAVMQCNGEIVLIEMPEILENALGLAARIDEYQGRAMRFDELIELAQRVAR
jgi:hypothetical protein